MIQRSQFFRTLLFIVTILMVLSSCKEGPMGPEGPQGPQGPQGEQGIKGADGSTILCGVGNPALTIGKVGDYYLDLSTKNLYGPKQDSKWGEPFSLKGDKGDTGSPGQDGANGSQMLSGAGVPSDAIGVNGDFYFDKEEVGMYGPKTNNDWGTPISLRSANQLGMKTIILMNYSFKKKPIPAYHPLDSLSEIEYEFIGESSIIPTTDYSTYYETGINFIYFRDPKDPTGSWREGIAMLMPETLWQDYKFGLNPKYAERGAPLTEMRLSTWDVEFRPDKILINPKYTIVLMRESREYWAISTRDTSVESEYNTAKGLINDYMKPDIKIVLIPGTQVQMLKQQGVNVNDRAAVSRALKLVDQRPGL